MKTENEENKEKVNEKHEKLMSTGDKEKRENQKVNEAQAPETCKKEWIVGSPWRSGGGEG